jgi:membrane-bound serine protease (ClpP class)
MEFVESAEMNGYPVALAECMVTAGREAWLVRNVRTRELRYVLKKDYRDRVRRGTRTASQPARLARAWELLRVLVAGDELLTVHPRLAMEYGFAARQIKVPAKGPPWADLIKHFHIVSEPVVLDNDWPDELVLSRARPRPAQDTVLADAGPRPAPATRPAGGGATTAPTSYASAPPGAKIVTTEGEEGWFAPRERKADAPIPPSAVTNAFIIPIREAISEKTYEAMKRKVFHAKGKGADLVVFDFDTPGGSSAAMRSIARLIRDEMPGIYTVAYVHPRAFSAGAVISLACNEIAMSPTGVIGDAMPIMIGPTGLIPIPEKERGKIESAARSEIRVLAKRNGYNVSLCEAMITITMEIWLIRHLRTRELRIVDATEWRGKVTGAPPTTQPARAAPDEAEWQYVKTLDGPNELVTLTADEAVFAGLVENVFASMDDLERHFHVVGEPTLLEDTWSERLVEFLTSAALTSILLMAALFCVYMEINTPGFGVAGSLAIVCFAILFGSRFLIGMAAWWEIALFIVGLVLVGLEVFVTPGFGVLGISGILCCVIALLAMVVPNAPNELPIPDTDLSGGLFKTGVAALILGAIGAVVAAALLARYLPKVPVAGRLVLAPATIVPSPTTDDAPITAVAVGDVGTVHSTCRPVGQVRFGETLVDAIADGDMLSAGAKVRVVKKEGNRIVVTREA